MTKHIEIEVLETNHSGHNDLLFNFKGLKENKKFDTYYFALAIEPKTGTSEVKKAVAILISKWVYKIVNCEIGDSLFLPIDFSDQYIGCLKVFKMENSIEVKYGFARNEGWSVNPVDPKDFFDSAKDFKENSNESLSLKQTDFINDLKTIINKLNNEKNALQQ